MKGTTTLGQEYTFPRPSELPRLAESDGVEFPTYLDRENQPRDKFYRLITHPPAGQDNEDNQHMNVFTGIAQPLIYRTPSERAPFPDPSNPEYQSLTDFENACDAWYTEFQRRLASTLLPTPVTGQFYCPELPKVFKQEEKTNPARFRTFKPDVWPLMPENYMEMLRVLYSKSEVDPETEFSVQIPRRELIKYKHHITSDQQWQSQFITHEPVPEIYDTFEEFETSYRNWRAIALSELDHAIIPPRMLNSLLGICNAEQSQFKPIVGTNDVQNGTFDAGNLSWAQKIGAPSKWVMMGEVLGNLKMEKMRKCETDENFDNVHVLGMELEARNFVKSMCIYGNTVSEKPVSMETPTGAVYIQTDDPDKVESAINVVKTAKEYNITLHKTLLDDPYNFSLEQWDEILNPEKKDGVRPIDVLSPTLNLRSLEKIFDYSEMSAEHRIRVSYFLRSVLRNDTTSGVIKAFFSNDHIPSLYRLMKILIETSDPRMHVIEPLEGDSKILVMINRFYLMTLVMNVFKDRQDTKWIRDVIDQLRQLSFNIAKSLKDKETLEMIRHNNTKALLMLLHCESPSVHRLILGSDYLLWLNECTDRTGAVILNTIVHGSAMYSASMLFLKYGCQMLKNIIMKLTPQMCEFVVAMCNYIYVRSDDIHLQFRGQHILTGLESASSAKTIHAGKVLIALSRLLAKPNLISNLKDSEFETKMLATIIKICGTLAGHSDLYTTLIVAVKLLAGGQNSCFAMTQQKALMDDITSHMNDRDVAVCSMTWDLIFKLCTSNKAMMEIILYKRFKESIGMITNGRPINYHALRRMLTFSAEVWDRHDVELRKKYCSNVLLTPIGSIVCLHKTSSIIFEHDKATDNAMSRFVNIVHSFRKYDDKESKDFLQAWEKHMDSQESKTSLLSKLFPGRY